MTCPLWLLCKNLPQCSVGAALGLGAAWDLGQPQTWDCLGFGGCVGPVVTWSLGVPVDWGFLGSGAVWHLRLPH